MQGSSSAPKTGRDGAKICVAVGQYGFQNGTSGYEFLDVVGGLLIHRDARVGAVAVLVAGEGPGRAFMPLVA
jgi:hypothetical protein